MNDAVKVGLGAIGGVLALLLVFVLFGGIGMFGMGPMMQGFGDGPGGMMGGGFGSSWWMLVPILFWVGLLALIAWAVIRIFPANLSGGGGRGRDPAEEILRERFARGEIGLEQYERSLDTLRGRPTERVRSDTR